MVPNINHLEMNYELMSFRKKKVGLFEKKGVLYNRFIKKDIGCSN